MFFYRPSTHTKGYIRMARKLDYSHLTSSDTAYIDSLYEDYKNNDPSLDESWQFFFKGFEYKLGDNSSPSSNQEIIDEFNAYRLIQSYRARGHLISDTNPIRPRKNRNARLDVTDYDLKVEDLEKEFACGVFVGMAGAKLKDILNHLKRVYC